MASPASRNAPSTHMTTTTLRVDGMTCGACTSAVESAFEDVTGVGSVSVSLVMERAVVTHNEDVITAEKVRDMIDDRGFDAEILSSDRPEPPFFDVLDDVDILEDEEAGKLGKVISITTVHVGGMTCGACTSAVEGAFKDLPGIKSFSISLLSERAVIEHDPIMIAPDKLAEIIEDTGFDAEILETKAADPLVTKSVSNISRRKLLTTTISIEGMTCGACTSAVEGVFKGLAGVVQFNISLLAERAVIMHDPDVLSATQIVEIIEDRGFDASIVTSIEEGVQTSSANATIHLKIYGLPSPESASELQATLTNITGIVSANINFGTSRASIIHSPTTIGLRALVEAVEKTGYNALVADSDDNNAQLESLAKTKEIQEWKRAFHTSLSFAIPVFLISMCIPMFIPALDIGSYELPIRGLYLGDVICMSLTIPVQFGIGRRFYISAYRSVKHASPTMDVLVVLGTSAAFFFSCATMAVSILLEPHSRPGTVFDTSTMLITFITLGRYLENRAKGQTSKALSRLMSLAPPMATIYADPIAAAKAAENWDFQEHGEKVQEGINTSAAEERTIPTELIEVGDIVLLKPGDKIPADGIVTRGESYVNESMVTGEAMPVNKVPGSPLMAGTVNNAGRMDFKVTRAGRDTQLSQIVRLVQEAQTSRAPIQRMADLVAGYFVPIIITLGLATFVGWMVLSHILPNPPSIFLRENSGGRLMVCVKLCISVIVFACPCALGLATPTAVMVGTGVGAEQGILVKGGAALETATKITHVLLDKTGTLTMGKMSVSQVEQAGAWKSNSRQKNSLWWTLVGLAEGNSEHPIAKAIVAGAREKLGLGPDDQIEGSTGDFKAVVGRGVTATIEPGPDFDRTRYKIAIGNASFLQSNGIEVPLSPEDGYGHFTQSSSREDVGSTVKNQNAGITTIHLAIDGEYAGFIGLSDSLKPSARAAIAALQRMRIRCSLVTGDQEATAHHVAALVGIPPENVFAGVVPEGKKRIVTEHQAQGEIVAMVGDGINDSPALATAHVGISLASGTDVAVDAADIVLMKPNQLMDIPASLQLSKTIFRRIKLNLLFSCIYNAIGLPIAMGFLLPWGITLPPMAAGAAMACSSVTVVVSSLLLKLWRRPDWLLEREEDALLRDLRRRSFGFAFRSIRDAITGRKRWNSERDRGEYVQLQTTEPV